MFASTDLKLILFRPLVAQVVCLCMGMILMGEIILFALALRDISHTQTNQTRNPIEKATRGAVKLDAGLSIPLFGEYIPKQLDDLNIKRSTLNLHVVGILYSTRKNDSQVIIRTSDGEEKAFKMGDAIPGGAILKQISTDGVLVKHDGVLESLSLPKNELIFDAPPKPLK
ncbi:MAG: type II secretion system protein N [Legionellaceae bacterium]|nr:type II secretion system protein N [Legionellaceae bacterium]